MTKMKKYLYVTEAVAFIVLCTLGIFSLYN